MRNVKYGILIFLLLGVMLAAVVAAPANTPTKLVKQAIGFTMDTETFNEAIDVENANREDLEAKIDLWIERAGSDDHHD